jgi:hypothetical protein
MLSRDLHAQITRLRQEVREAQAGQEEARAQTEAVEAERTDVERRYCLSKRFWPRSDMSYR